MAVAVLIHTYSDETLDEIDGAERQWIKEDIARRTAGWFAQWRKRKR
jgi:hypothetical protein